MRWPVAGARRLHYGFVVMLLCMLVATGALGLGRFAYTMILPGMRVGLSLSYTQMGLLASGNFAGYLVAALIGGLLAARYGPRLVIGVCLLLTGVATTRADVFPRWAGILLLAATAGFFFDFFIADFLPPMFGQVGAAGFGALLALALAWIGAALAMGYVGPVVSGVVLLP